MIADAARFPAAQSRHGALILVVGLLLAPGLASAQPASGADCSSILDRGLRSLAELSATVTELLKPGVAEGTGEVWEADRVAILTGKVLDVPGFIQDGPTCGLYALRDVMTFYNTLDSKNPWPPGKDGESGSAHPSLYSVGKKKRVLWNDGGTTPWGLEEIAEAYGYKAEIDYTGKGMAPTIADLKAALARGVPPICAMADLSATGGDPVRNVIPGSGHWVVVQGFKVHEGIEYVIVKHGHATDDYIWRLSDFEKSWASTLRPVVYVTRLP